MPERSFNQGVNTRMSVNASSTDDRKMTSVFEHYLTLWVLLCILAGIALGKLAPGLARYLNGLAIHVDGAPVVSIPVATATMLFGLSSGAGQPAGAPGSGGKSEG